MLCRRFLCEVNPVNPLSPALSLLFPQENACHFCERFLPDGGFLCGVCRAALEAEQLENPLMQRSLFPLEACLSAYRYSGMAKELIHYLKYRSDCALADVFAAGMLMALVQNHALYREIDLVIPVPLHASRLYERGYNQAEYLARAMAAPARLPVRASLLARTYATATQIGRTRVQRIAALRGAFAVTDPSAVRGRCILLVDDVFTTGATAIACAEPLKRAGAREVTLITACRA